MRHKIMKTETCIRNFNSNFVKLGLEKSRKLKRKVYGPNVCYSKGFICLLQLA